MASRRDTSSDRTRTRKQAGRRTSARAQPQARARPESASVQDEAAQTQLLQSLQQMLLAGVTAFTRAQKVGPAAFQEALLESVRLLGRSRSTARGIVRDAFGSAQETLQSRMGSAREQAQETMENIEALFQSRVQRTLHQLGVPTAEEIRLLTRRVAELNASVSQLAPRARARKSARPVAKTQRRAQQRRRATRANGENSGDEVT